MTGSESPAAGRGAGSATGAVVVNFNAGSALAACVESLRTAGVAMVVVVDNNSHDGSAEQVSAAGATLVRQSHNLGYGTAANRGVERLDSAYVLISNPDVVVSETAVDRLVAVLDQSPDVGAVGPRIDNPDGTPYPSARAFPSLATGAAHAFVGLFRPANRWSRRYRGEGGGDGTREVDWVSGACVLVRRLAFDSVGGFDEGYFMYVEDLDLCWRLRRAGWRVCWCPGAVVTHAQGLSTRRHPLAMLVAHHRSTFRFARKSLTGPRAALLPVVGGALAVRLGLAASREVLRGRRK